MGRETCVQCGFGMYQLFLQYSPGNIRLMRCTNTSNAKSWWITRAFIMITIVLIDLILHKPQAYRHLLYNVLNRDHLSCQVR